MTTCAQYISILADAQTALHKLTIGNKVVALQDGEHRINYSKADIDQLRVYVDSLQSKVDCCNGIRGRSRRVMHIIPLG